MSTLPDNELDLDKLFLPAWAQEPSASKYAKYEGEEQPDRRGDRDRRGPRGPRRDEPRGRRDDRPRGERRGPRPEGGAPRPEGRGRPEGLGRPEGGRRGDRPDFRRGEPRERREPPRPLPDLEVNLRPDDKGVESLARQIKMTGRAYPLFDIAQMILQKPERHMVQFGVKKNAEGQPIAPLFVCALDDTLWLSEDEAVQHVLRKHFATFYQADRTATEPPKGKYTFVAQCGMSGVVLGPPNHHDYQNVLRKLHAERFSRMPFEVYKARVKIVRDEEVVKKWVDDQSWKTEYVCLNMPEPLKLPDMAAVEKHFREVHKSNIIKPVDSHTLTGAAARSLRSSDLVRLVRSVWDDQRRFPLQIATVLSQQFASHGLQFFKVNKTVTHVSVARPHYLDLEATPVSEGVKQIVNYINANPKCNRPKLIEALAPSPPLPVTPPPVAEPGAEPAAAAPKPDGSESTPEQMAVKADLHWLIHEGHVIEFANGVLETAKKPLPKPPKPEPKQPAIPAAAEAATAPEAAAQVSEPDAAPATNEALTTEAQAAPTPIAEPAEAEPPKPVTEAVPAGVAPQSPVSPAPAEPAVAETPAVEPASLPVESPS